ncbi:hypothetical protein ACGFZQ_42950 [Streptomyces sp. NPDC048254]|uniref:hypothetical protein n=1 Tax=Streptomyces sp. NPDC048254 TaxID=3365525 RepID=UPI00371FC12A
MAKLTEEQRQQRAAARARQKALAAEEEDRQEIERRETWAREGTCLTWEEFEAREPCRGCGKPMYDRLGSWYPLMKLSEEERREYEAAEARFKEEHPNCRSSRWSISESRVSHCSRCCPPPPLGPQMVRKLAGFFAALPSEEERKKNLDAWDLTLTCDHVAEHIQHRDHGYVSARVVDCPECGERRGVVQSVRVGPAYTSEAIQAGRVALDQERLASELSAAQEKLRREERKAEATRRRIKEMQKQLKLDS